MRAVGIKALNSRLSEYVRRAESGETILVTNRQRVVAEIHPPRATTNPWLTDPVLADMVRKGEITPPTLSRKGRPPSGKRVAPLAQLLRELDEDRADRDLP